MLNNHKTVINQGLTKNEKNDFAVYLAILLAKEPELQAVIAAWPSLPDRVKRQIKRLVKKHMAAKTK